ncbi:hypothetical protein [Micromonospora chersina]|uniref:hypothetical protein n=1 Tax=Micromonospora chersina TaxID=47854 RepID=UPI00371C43D9
MGASGWSYSVAYQPYVTAALEQSRQDAYDRSAYYREEPDERRPRIRLLSG